MEIMKPFGEFINKGQASNCLLFEFHEHYMRLQDDLENTLLEEGFFLKSALIFRFTDTANGL